MWLRRIALSLLLLLILAPAVSPTAPAPVAQAQGEDDACPALVADALESLDANCTQVGRNEVCYGNNLLSAEFWQADAALVFANPSDRVPAADVRLIAGAPLQLAESVWGLGLLRLQANLPNTLPGQAITFLLMGDVEVESAVAPDELRTEAEPLLATTTAGVNLRTGPGTTYSLLGSVPNGAALLAIGRSSASDWVQVATAEDSPAELLERIPLGTRAWLSASLLRIDGDVSTLPVITSEPAYGPLEAFYFTTGFGELECQSAPPDHLLVNSPEGIEVAFNANGVEFTLGSTAALRRPRVEDGAPSDVMTVTTFEGKVVLKVVIDGVEYFLEIPPGLEADVPLGTDENGNIIPIGAPQNFRPLNPADWAAYAGLSEHMTLIGGGFTVPDPPAAPPSFDEVQEVVEEVISGGGGSGGGTTTTGIPLGTGEVQVTLVWDTLADMDLSVQEPGGALLYYNAPNSPTGGVLDLDSNFPCGENLNYAENAYWPAGQAPAGTYRVFVRQFSTCGAGNANWTLIVRVNGVIVLQESGSGGNSEFSFTR
ncbi:MAG: SH3 domain-containing protein [Anaerolineae bacterium]|nr:SH3 domain-containing protein [Anaerolineae bacterium]